MGESTVEIVEITKVEPHPDPETAGLDVAWVYGYPVVVKRGQYQAGDKATYIPIDNIIPDNDEFAAVYKYTKRGRVRAAKLRGQLSMGLLWRLPDGVAEGFAPTLPFGQHVDGPAEFFGIQKYEPPVGKFVGVGKGKPKYALADPGYMGVYDVEGLRKYSNIFVPGEQVQITEKLHGANFRACLFDGKFWVGSRKLWLDPEVIDNPWAETAKRLDIEQRLRDAASRWPTVMGDIGIYGELLGVQDLHYGYKADKPGLRLFDIYRIRERKFFPVAVEDHENDIPLWHAAMNLDLATVPVLYTGSWDPEKVVELAEGPSTFGYHTREGVVIKPLHEGFDRRIGRRILKYVGEGYLLRKEAA